LIGSFLPSFQAMLLLSPSSPLIDVPFSLLSAAAAAATDLDYSVVITFRK
jgi:hypothetical protein